MKRSKQIFIFLLGAFTFAGCLKKPKVCVELEDYYEVNREYQFASCSENFEFLTWDFGDSTAGYIGDNAPHTFRKRGNPVIRLTAYGNGAYRSDEYKKAVKTSRRYLDHFDVIGPSTFNAFELKFNNKSFERDGASGTFSEDMPFVGQIWPEEQVIIPYESGSIGLNGLKSGNETLLLLENINFRSNTDNPIILEAAGGRTLKLYWTYSF